MTAPTDPQIAAVVEGLSDLVRADFTTHWDCICDADPLPCDYDEYVERMESGGFARLVPVDREALESAFAWERGIEPGGMMWELTPLGLAVRAHLERQGDER